MARTLYTHTHIHTHINTVDSLKMVGDVGGGEDKGPFNNYIALKIALFRPPTLSNAS